MRYILKFNWFDRKDFDSDWQAFSEDQADSFVQDGRKAYDHSDELWLDDLNDDFEECEECEATHRETHWVFRAEQQWIGGNFRCEGKVKLEKTKYFKLVA